MKRKYVKESLDEQWYSTDTGIDRYAPYFNSNKTEISDDPEEMVPPPTEKFTAESFDEYINSIIDQILPQSPVFALNVFTTVIKEHPYLTKRPIGFKSTNPYQESINKFLQTFKTVVSKR